MFTGNEFGCPNYEQSLTVFAIFVSEPFTITNDMFYPLIKHRFAIHYPSIRHQTIIN